jgi:hypothetical protein
MMTRLMLLSTGLCAALGLPGCENLRVYTSFHYKHVRSEIQKKPTGEREYLAGIFQDGTGWTVRVMETLTCEQRTVEVAHETAKIKVTAPTWYYFVGLGGLTAAVSTPFWVLGSLAKDRKEATKHYLVGSLLFLLPGLAIVGTGLYYRLRAGTYYKKLGLRRRTKNVATVPCKVAPAVGRTVRLGTRTGQKDLGKTDAQGMVRLEVQGLRPLVRWDAGKVVKVYFDVQVENEPGQEVRLPKGFPVHAADLREPRPGD